MQCETFWKLLLEVFVAGVLMLGFVIVATACLLAVRDSLNRKKVNDGRTS